MLGLLLKKQFVEVFRSYFYDAKKNRMRSKGSIILFFAFFVIVMVGMLGGMFTMLSISLCRPMTEAGIGWMYFLIMGGIAILLGAFGSVFNTYASLYLAKDNDLLLSLPIPARTIMTARLINVYLMGTLYSSVVLLPALIVYWVTAGATLPRIVCGVLFMLIITVIILLLSCLLGWIVAKLSLRLKNKSFVTVILSLLFVGLYYFVYFKANDLIQDIILNAAVYGEKIKGASYGLYLFGRIGDGDWPAAGIFTAAVGVLFVLLWNVMSRSFLKIATSTGKVARVKYVEKTAKERSPFAAVLGKEFKRFTSSPNYMLNCGMAIILILAMSVLMIIMGPQLVTVFQTLFGGQTGPVGVLLAAFLCGIASMNDMAAPSVSLEGKNLWILQSLPVPAKNVLRAKASMQLILTGIPMLFATVCTAIILPGTFVIRLLVVLVPLAFTAFSALFDTFLGIKMPMLNWTNEMYPIKQGGAIMFALFGGWAFCIALGGLYFLVGNSIGAELYLIIWLVLFLAGSVFFLHYLDTKGSRKFAEL